MQKPLEAQGHQVIAAGATDGEERLREGGIDVVVVEYELDGGIEPFVQALDRLPDPPPFVLVGGTSDAPAGSARLGAAAFIMKPCNPDELVSVLRRMMPTSARSSGQHRAHPAGAEVEHVDDEPTQPHLPMPPTRRS